MAKRTSRDGYSGRKGLDRHPPNAPRQAVPRVCAKKQTPPADRPILYVKAGGPPDNWRKVRVIRRANGQEVRDVVEANAHDGWFDQAVRDKAGNIERDKVRRMIIRRVRAAIRLEIRP